MLYALYIAFATKTTVVAIATKDAKAATRASTTKSKGDIAVSKAIVAIVSATFSEITPFSAAAKAQSPIAKTAVSAISANLARFKASREAVTTGRIKPKVVKVAIILSPKDISSLFHVSTNPFKLLISIAIADIFCAISTKLLLKLSIEEGICFNLSSKVDIEFSVLAVAPIILPSSTPASPAESETLSKTPSASSVSPEKSCKSGRRFSAS